MSMDDCYNMVSMIDKAEAVQKTGLALKDFVYLYGMSKCVVAEEILKGHGYIRTKFLEMCELIGRLTIFKNFNTHMEDLPMYK